MGLATVSPDFAKAIFAYLAEMGHSAEAVLRAAGIASARLLASRRVPLALYEHLGADAYRIEAAPEFFEQKALYGEEDLYRVTVELARDRLAQLRGEDRLLNKVCETVLQQLPGGLPKVQDVAAHLDMSARTLQRRLQERNLRYQQVLDEVRSELARQLIRDRSLSLNDVADYLGFNDQSAFQHAFRRWQCMSPGHYRRRLLGSQL